MTELSHGLDESFVDRIEDDHFREHREITETLLPEENCLEDSKKLPYLLVLTCGGAG